MELANRIKAKQIIIRTHNIVNSFGIFNMQSLIVLRYSLSINAFWINEHLLICMFCLFRSSPLPVGRADNRRTRTYTQLCDACSRHQFRCKYNNPYNTYDVRHARCQSYAVLCVTVLVQNSITTRHNIQCQRCRYTLLHAIDYAFLITKNWYHANQRPDGLVVSHLNLSFVWCTIYIVHGIALNMRMVIVVGVFVLFGLCICISVSRNEKMCSA